MNNYSLNVSRFSTHKLITDLVGQNRRVLDVGCNDGYIGSISNNSNEFYGLDYSAESVKKAKQMYIDAIVYDLNDLTSLPWNIKFDVIIFADVLEHVLYPDLVLRFFKETYLKKDGRVIFSLPNIANWQIRFKLLFGNFNYTDSGILDKTHLHFYTFKTAVEFIKESGLKIDKVLFGASFFGYVLSIIPFLKSLLATSIIILATYD